MSISQFVAGTGARMRVFDLGRRVAKIGQSEFEAFENLARPYPVPYLRHAWVGILSWNPEQPGQHNIWFLKLPLDEQNILQPGPRDDFLKHWLRVVENPDKDHGEAPCAFKPDGNRMAYFHALALKTLKQDTTQYYTTARAYFSGDTGWENWQQLGLQGIAEMVARLDEQGNSTLLQKALPQMDASNAAVPRNVLLGFLENAEPDVNLTIALTDSLATRMKDQPSATDLALYCRAMSQSVSVNHRREILELVLKHPLASEVEVLSAVASRCWQDLEGDILSLYLERLALAGQDVFLALVADLMTLPGKRKVILEAFRNPQRSEELGAAIGILMNAARGGVQ
ncbi:MAG: DUF3549 family protein [Pseudomonadota bacterium]|nr:DUF3549 family protein [Pseudomonadota bacterium]MEC8104659.1 DUF3549 family protein [Pseudomonadota bacterium]